MTSLPTPLPARHVRARRYGPHAATMRAVSNATAGHLLDDFIHPEGPPPPVVAQDPRATREVVALFLLILGVLLLIAVLGLYDYRLALGGAAVVMIGTGITLGLDR